MTTKIVDGKVFYINSAGAMVPEEAVKDTDKLRDDVVNTIVERIIALEKRMKEIKTECMNDIEAFIKILAEQYKVEIGGVKGNVQLTSFDGTKQVLLNMSRSIEVNEGVEIAKQLIDEYLIEITGDSTPEIRALVGQAFRVKQGKMDVRRLLELKQLNIKDERWMKAMEAISESIVVTASKPCLRLRDKDKNGEYKTHLLEFATM